MEKLNTRLLGEALLYAGAGRQKISDTIDTDVSLFHPVKTGSKVSKGDVLFRLTLNNISNESAIATTLKKSIAVGNTSTKPYKLIEEVIGL